MIYTPNLHFAGGDIEVPVAEGYSHNVGSVQAMLDNMDNHTAIFEALIANDFTELEAMRNPEAFTEAQIEAIQEASVGGFFTRIWEFVKKAWEKVKGLFKSFWDTIRAMLTRDNKELVSKFKGEVLKKDLSKMKVKYRKPTGKSPMAIDIPGALSAMGCSSTGIQTLAGKGKEAIQKIRTEIADTDNKEKILGKLLGQSSVTQAEFQKEAMDLCFDDREEHEGLSSSDLTEIMTGLTESSKIIKEAKKYQADTDKAFKTLLSNLDKERTKVNKLIPDKDGKSNDANVNMSAALSCMYEGVSVLQNCVNTSLSAEFAITKFSIRQCRSVFMSAIRFNPKAVKESNMLFEHYEDESNFEFDTMMEGVGF